MKRLRFKRRGDKRRIRRDITTPLPPKGMLDGFDAFWKAYPRKVGKGAALKAWRKVDCPLEAVLKAVEWQLTSRQWTKDNGEYIPHPATWLNKRQWEDEPAEMGTEERYVPL